jgi:Zn-dependent peptidase ImmA (M78 family)/transcriptional regulator with XRE-family HTH domain
MTSGPWEPGSGDTPLFDNGTGDQQSVARAVADAFDPARLTQARHLAGVTKRWVADYVGVSAVAVGQWESKAHPPRPDHVVRLAEALKVEPMFFGLGRPYARLDSGAAHFRSLRKTPAHQRAKAVAFAEQVWELTQALERRVELPRVDVPGFSAGEVPTPGKTPAEAARELRTHWGTGDRQIPRLVRLMERHGIVVTLTPFAGESTATVDAFSTSNLPRPLVVLTPDRADDIYRHRFTAAHELGHLVLHGGEEPAGAAKEKEADEFAAEFLMPFDAILDELPKRLDFQELDRLSVAWGVSVEALIYRCHEVGTVSESAYRRAFQRLAQLRQVGLFGAEPVTGYTGEVPAMLRSAYEIAHDGGLTMAELSTELRIAPSRIRLLLGLEENRVKLTLA